MKQDLMKGVIDMHVHTNPDLRLRAYDDFELMEAAIRVGARAIVIKTHQGTTMDRAYLCNRHNEIVHGKTNNFTMFGSITLNKVVGGINPKAVDVALRLGAKVVWLPTQSAKNHMQKMNQDLSQSVEVVKDGKIVPELRSVLELIRDHNAVLGTAHIAPEEIFTEGYIPKLYQMTTGSYDELTGDLELPAVQGEPKVFVLTGNGTGTGVFRRLQREGIPFAAGILWENDLDYPSAKALAVEVVSEKVFTQFSEAQLARAKQLIDNCERVICTLDTENLGSLGEGLRELKEYALKLGKL